MIFWTTDSTINIGFWLSIVMGMLFYLHPRFFVSYNDCRFFSGLFLLFGNIDFCVLLASAEALQTSIVPTDDLNRIFFPVIFHRPPAIYAAMRNTASPFLLPLPYNVVATIAGVNVARPCFVLSSGRCSILGIPCSPSYKQRPDCHPAFGMMLPFFTSLLLSMLKMHSSSQYTLRCRDHYVRARPPSLL